MKHRECLKSSRLPISLQPLFKARIRYHGRRHAHSDALQRRTTFWIPPVILAKKSDPSTDATHLLSNAGYLRQAYSGIYHMLPLGLRVQNKIERLIDKHMSSIGSSKVSLSSLSSQELWNRSGRLATGTEFFKLVDRKDAKFILSPTHEEEITRVVGGAVQSYKDLPIRVYQIGRKYRDERRPRGGLLRGREFLMKDLYTFDVSEAEALATYDAVRGAYTNFFDELGVDYLQARADSGEMGGSLSHEFHFLHPSGEDDILQCSQCGFARNSEVVDEVHFQRKPVPLSIIGLTQAKSNEPRNKTKSLASCSVISTDHKSLVRAFAPVLTSEMPSTSARLGDGIEAPSVEFNKAAIKSAFANILDLDTGIEGPNDKFLDSVLSNKTSPKKSSHNVYYLFDSRIDGETAFSQIEKDSKLMLENGISTHTVEASPKSPNQLNLLKPKTGDPCPSCQHESLRVVECIEVGHTFHLGTHYSSRLGAKVAQATKTSRNDIEMGCHGIGVSRLIAAVAACLADEKGLNWPRAIAPFQVAIISKREQSMDLVEAVMELHSGFNPSIDVLYDDREDTNLAWKMNDADLIGYPVMVIFGKAWESGEGKVEVQCRLLKVKADVVLGDVPHFVESLLQQL